MFETIAKPAHAIELMRQFHNTASQHHGQVEFFSHPSVRDINGRLETGVLRVGDENADTVIFLTSGIHGVELWAGTACQLDLIRSGRLNNLPKGVAVVMVHAANPWGAVNGRRYTEENVDLCRNFVDFRQPLPDTLAGYHTLKDAFDALPTQATEADAVLDLYAAKHDIPALYAATMSGQYVDAHGLGFGGTEPTWARRSLEGIMNTHAKKMPTISMHWIIIQELGLMPMVASLPCSAAQGWSVCVRYLATGSLPRVKVPPRFCRCDGPHHRWI